MRVVVQKVTSASVSVGADDGGAREEYHSEIGAGLLLLVGVSDADGDAEVEWIARKIAHLRIFEDSNDKMNLSVKDVGGAILSVSQFTLFGDIHKGNRPSFVSAGEPEHARKVWKQLDTVLEHEHGLVVREGVFGAHMKVELLNDGPVTLVIDTERDMRHWASP